MFSNLTQFLKEFGAFRIAVVIGGFLLFILLFAIYMFSVSNKSMVPLYADLELSDSNRIVQELENQHIQYELAAGGSVVRVPEDQVLKMRVSLAQLGLPNKGSMVGYEIFDKEEGIGSTSFMQNVKMLRALEGELSRTIESFERVEKARVHLVMPKNEMFARDRNDTRASISLKLRSSGSLSKGEIDAVVHLVASAVPNLSLENITVVDTKGRSLRLGMNDDSNSSGSSGSMETDDRRVAYENRIKNVIEELLSHTLGSGKIVAQVAVEMSFDKIVKNSEWFDPNGSVLRSSQTSTENERTPTGEETSDISVSSSVPGASHSSASSSGGMATVARSDETSNFEISKTITNQISDVGTVKKLSIAVMVDGTYALAADGKPGAYAERTTDEIKKIEDMVKVAVGFDDKRGDQIKVLSMPFSVDYNDNMDESVAVWVKSQLPELIQTLVIAAVIILVFVSVVRPIAMKAFEIQHDNDTPIIDPLKVMGLSTNGQAVPGAVLGGISAVAGDGGGGSGIPGSEDKIEIKTSQNAIHLKKVNDFVQQYPQETVLLIRRWMNEDM